MTLAESVIEQALIAGFNVNLVDGKPVVSSPDGRRPNAALMAALREHRIGIIGFLSGQPVAGRPCERPEPVRCNGVYDQRRGKQVECGAWIFEACDSEFFCTVARCPHRARARRR